MIDFELADTGELEFVSGDFTTVTGSDQVLQHVKARIRTFYEEYAFDTSSGVKYFEEIFVKDPDMAIVDSLIKAAIVETPGVVELVGYSSSFDASARSLTVSAEYYDEFNPTRINQFEEVL